MGDFDRVNITELLNRASSGDAAAARAVYPAVYLELERSARAARAVLPTGDTLSTAALVNEAFIRINGREEAGWENRRQFFFYAARAMRDLLVEEARRARSLKRSGEHVSLTSIEIPMLDDDFQADVLSLHEALEQLRRSDAEGYDVVMLRFFAGLEVAEVAAVIGVSKSSVERKWRFVRVWLERQLQPPEPGLSDG